MRRNGSRDEPLSRARPEPTLRATASDAAGGVAAWRGVPFDLVSEFSAADVLRVAQVAELLGCSERHIYNLAERGDLPGVRYLGRSVLVVKPVLVAWLMGHDA